jgi:protease PrsW
LGIRFGMALGAFMSLVVMTILLLTIGVEATFVGTLLAFLPAPFYILLFVWLDRYDPEPTWALVAAFGWGALFSIFISFILNSLFGSFAESFVGEPAGLTLSAIISAPLVEEGSKGLGLVLILIFLRKEFDGVLDGIVYAGIIALGFATIENVLYYGKTFAVSGGSGLLAILFLRGVLSPFAHSLFTSMTGIGCGISRETHDKTLRWIAPIIGYFGAVLLHGLWNGLASITENYFFIIYFGVWVPLFFIFVAVLLYVGRRERLILRQMLTPEVATGLLSTQQMEILGSTLRRISWLISSFGNWKQFSARRHFLKAAGKLGFCYWHASRAEAANQETLSLSQIPRFRAQVAALQPQV